MPEVGGGVAGWGLGATGGTSVAACPARAALAGNPSDGYGGAVLAITVEALSAQVRLGGDGPPASDRLTAATLRRFTREFGIEPPAAQAPALTTTIPRSVGLGGSSAIVIATLRALASAHDVAIDPDALAILALSIEVDDLGIAAGLQDRLVQAHGGLVFMEFAGPRPTAQRLAATGPDAGVGPLLVAWHAEHGEDSGVVHSDLRERFMAGDRAVQTAMAHLGELARAAREAVVSGDRAALGAAMDASFDVRAGLLELAPAHVALVQIGRRAGAAVNYTGSGGAVVCLCDSPGHREAVARAFREGGAATVPA